MDICEVQKIINKRHQNGKMHFLIKWDGYSHAHNSWEPEENLVDCAEALSEFERKNATRILSAGQNQNSDIHYLVELKSELKTELVSADRVAVLWPDHLVSFLEERIVWRRRVDFDSTSPVENQPVGQARRITYVTNVGSTLLYWVEYDDGSQFVSAKEARKKYSNLIIEYLQPHLLVVD
ncbi:chromobox protein homolog 5-like [Sitodiplosis mosellana]|uniref:chromobox protein homolog 5-like n=1 Tax=Sitodiplosis mosellana TaxID=263140 RepID=UPI002443D08F|nr:chromobox protein homolog 5-like [Sitodiplosis mosellana]